jgi:hypothetical protein
MRILSIGYVRLLGFSPETLEHLVIANICVHGAFAARIYHEVFYRYRETGIPFDHAKSWKDFPKRGKTFLKLVLVRF